MTEQTKPDYQYIWSSGGSLVAPSSVKIQTGWTAEVPPFQWENYVQNRQDQAISHILQKGISVWSSTGEYYFTTSGERSYVQGSDGNIYVALQDSVGQNPVTDTTFAHWAKAMSGGLLNVRTFSTAGTYVYTSTPGTRAVIVEVQGAGGAGSGAPATGVGQASIGSGGGAGAYAKSLITSGFSGQTITVGAGGAGVSGAAGSTGGPSSFGSLVSCPGGRGGDPRGPSAGLFVTWASASSAPSGGNIQSNIGQGSDLAIVFDSTNMQFGRAGQSLFGAGGQAGGAGPAGVAATSPGSGGGGTALTQSLSALTGGAGAAGIVIVWEYL